MNGESNTAARALSESHAELIRPFALLNPIRDHRDNVIGIDDNETM
jgi:hypothetical protein